MNNIKMIFQNIISLKLVYLTYFFSLLTTTTIYISFIYFITSALTFIRTELHVNILSRFDILVYILFFGLGLLIASLMYIANKMLFSTRAKEYSVYRIIGIKKQQITLLIFIEQLIIIAGSFFIAYFLGALTANIALIGLEQFILRSLDVTATFSLQLINPLFLLLVAVIISIILAQMITRYIYKQQIIDLINFKATTKNTVQSERFVKIKFMLLLTVTIIYMIAFFDFSNRINSTEFIVYFCLFLGLLFMTIITLGKALVAIVPEKYYYRGANSFKQSIITSSMNYNLKLISLTTILFTISISMFSFSTLYIYNINQSQLPGDLYMRRESVLQRFSYNNKNYDFLVETPYYYYDGPVLIGDQDFSTETGVNLDLNVGEAIGLQPNYDQTAVPDLKVVTTLDDGDYTNYSNAFIVDQSMLSSRQKLIDQVQDLGGNLLVYDYIYNYDNNLYIGNKSYNLPIEFISLSEYEQLTNSSIAIDPTYMYLVSKLNDDEQMNISFNHNKQVVSTYPLKKLEIPETINQNNNANTYIIYDDSIQTDLLKLADSSLRTTYIVNDPNYNYEDYRAIFPPTQYLYQSKTENATNFLMYIITFGSLIIISIFILILIITILGLKAVSEGIYSREDYNNLKKLNYRTKVINNIANQLTAIYFFVPLLIGIFTACYSIVLYFNYSKSFAMISGLLIEGEIINSMVELYFGLFIFYILYYLIVNYNYKRIINK